MQTEQSSQITEATQPTTPMGVNKAIKFQDDQQCATPSPVKMSPLNKEGNDQMTPAHKTELDNLVVEV